MMHKELLSIALSFHVAVLFGSLVAWYKYGDRSDILAKSLEGTESILSRLRMMISNDLLSAIKECLSSVPTNLQLILGPDGKNTIYSERIANFLESERFRQVVMDFVELKTDMVSDYRILKRAKKNWCLWARILSWSILVLIILQILFLTVHGFVDKIIGKSLPDWGIHASLAITGFLIFFIFCLPFPNLLRSHDAIIQNKVKYDAP